MTFVTKRKRPASHKNKLTMTFCVPCLDICHPQKQTNFWICEFTQMQTSKICSHVFLMKPQAYLTKHDSATFINPSIPSAHCQTFSRKSYSKPKKLLPTRLKGKESANAKTLLL